MSVNLVLSGTFASAARCQKALQLSSPAKSSQIEAWWAIVRRLVWLRLICWSEHTVDH